MIDPTTTRLQCRHCQRPCANGTGLSAHERHCNENPELAARLAAAPPMAPTRMATLNCRTCGRACTGTQGLAAHERTCETASERPRPSTTRILVADTEPLGQWRHLWSDGPFGTTVEGKRRGAVPTDTGCIGTPDGRVVPAGRAA